MAIPKKPSKLLQTITSSEDGVMGAEAGMGYSDAGLGVATDIIGAIGADQAHKGQAKGTAIGGGVGAGIGMLVGGPLGAGVGKALGGMVGGLIGGGSDKRKALAAETDRIQKDNWNVDLTANVNPYGQYEEGGMVGPEDPKPKFQTRRLQPVELDLWNGLVDYVGQKGYLKNPQINAKDGSFSKGIFEEYRKTNPKFTLKYEDVPSVQNEFLMERETGRRLLGKADSKAASTYGSEYSDIDGFAGDKTLSQRFKPLMVNTMRDNNLVSSQNIGLMDGTGTTQNTGNRKALPRGVKLETLSDGKQYYEDPQSGDMIPYMEEGGAVYGNQDMMAEQYETPDQQPQPKIINIEKGEIMTDKDGNIMQEFSNPNRYSKHADNQFKEAKGNFVEAPGGAVVVPNRLAKRFKSGDTLTRRSIMRQLIDNQVQDPTINNPKGGEQFAEGGYTGIDPIKNLNPELNNEIYKELAVMDIQGEASNGTTNRQALGITAGTPGIKASEFVTPSAVNPTPGNKLDWGMVGRRVGSKIPAMFQMVNAMAGDPHLRPEYNRGTDAAKSAIMQTPEEYNVNDMLSSIDQQTAAAIEAIGQNNSPSARAELAAVTAKANEAKGQVYATAQKAKGQMRTNKLAQLANLEMQGGAGDQAENIRVQTERRMNAANDQNIVANSLSENYRMDSGWQNDMEKIKMINSMSKFENIDPFVMSRFVDDPGAREYIWSELQKSRPIKEIIADLTTSTSAKPTTSKSTTKKS